MPPLRRSSDTLSRCGVRWQARCRWARHRFGSRASPGQDLSARAAAAGADSPSAARASRSQSPPSGRVRVYRPRIRKVGRHSAGVILPRVSRAESRPTFSDARRRRGRGTNGKHVPGWGRSGLAPPHSKGRGRWHDPPRCRLVRPRELTGRPEELSTIGRPPVGEWLSQRYELQDQSCVGLTTILPHPFGSFPWGTPSEGVQLVTHDEVWTLSG